LGCTPTSLEGWRAPQTWARDPKLTRKKNWEPKLRRKGKDFGKALPGNLEGRTKMGGAKYENWGP